MQTFRYSRSLRSYRWEGAGWLGSEICQNGVCWSQWVSSGCSPRTSMAGSEGGSRRVRMSSCLAAGPRTANIGFAVAASDRDAGGCPGDQPLAGIGQSRVGGVKMQALAVSAQVLCPGWIRGARGAGGDESEPLVDAVCGGLRGQIDVPSRRELSVRQVDGRFVGTAARPEAGRADAGQRPHQVAASGCDCFDDPFGAGVQPWRVLRRVLR